LIRVLSLLAITAALCASTTAQPQDGGADGVITSEAVTVAGHDFCQYFIAAWRDKPGGDHYSLAIRERPSARLGSEIWIEFAQRRVFQARLPSARAAIKGASEQAADLTYEAVVRADMQRKLINDADLAPDEF